ncbi:hypothetical protein [Corynebacterium lujinxingii]|uniref:Uncharacterized protein n=1 Tax=Corynebacterium lujinxingii TaxID=2763010 RepID=A0A7H0K1I8_9CORY|nr:hypothetical protein [Corynebacterium lujinxingii]MBC3178615.1 hypothetical protein [Corynebacterium lujinxingii]NNO10453.1 hypothetical protein [Corynebacterium lujinxingii]QNP91154.1 hypothetical protein IAU68_05185 [Corynebacterium lujinxingii]
MSVELDEISGFLGRYEPFSSLPEEELRALPAQMGITYVRRGNIVVDVGQPKTRCLSSVPAQSTSSRTTTFCSTGATLG